MPFELLPEPKGIYKRFWGHVTGEEFVAAVVQNHKRREYDDSVYSINDFSDVTSHDLDTPGLLTAAAHAVGAWYSNPDVLVLVVAADPGIRQLARRFGGLTQYEVEMFDTLDAARERLQHHQPSRKGRVSGWGPLT
jgi:hypothetical protein